VTERARSSKRLRDWQQAATGIVIFDSDKTAFSNILFNGQAARLSDGERTAFFFGASLTTKRQPTASA
jgi:predicted ABC-class ATPase